VDRTGCSNTDILGGHFLNQGAGLVERRSALTKHGTNRNPGASISSSNKGTFSESCASRGDVVICKKCGRDNTLSQGQNYCAFCGNSLDLPEQPSQEPSGNASSQGETPGSAYDTRSRSEEQYSCPWEKLEETGFLQGLLLTLKQSLFEPTHFFSRIPRRGGWTNPVFYGVFVGTVGNLGGYILGTLLDFPWVSQGKLSPGFTLFLGLVMPLLVFVGILVWTILLHASLLLFGVKREPFEATLRIVSYSSSPEVFNFLPGIGWLVAAIWKLVLTVIGVREVQGVSTGRALLAVLFPVFVVWGVFFAGILMLIALGVFLLGSI